MEDTDNPRVVVNAGEAWMDAQSGMTRTFGAVSMSSSTNQI